MGRVLRKEKYTRGECSTAILLLTGAAMFFYSTLSDHDEGGNDGMFWTGFSAFTLMAGYLAFDAFTPNWQKKLLDTKPKISRYQVRASNISHTYLKTLSRLKFSPWEF